VALDKYTKQLEKITELQDQAITALKQANLALTLALETIERARKEQGNQLQLPYQYQYQYGYMYPQTTFSVPSVFSGNPFISASTYGSNANAVPYSNVLSQAKAEAAAQQQSQTLGQFPLFNMLGSTGSIA
jgi:hypothetical protein